MQNLSFGERYPVSPAGTYLERTFSTKGDIHLVRIHERRQGSAKTYAMRTRGRGTFTIPCCLWRRLYLLFYKAFAMTISCLSASGGFRDCEAMGRNHMRGPCLKVQIWHAVCSNIQ